MYEVFQFLMSNVEFGKFYAPMAVLIAACFAGFSFVLKSSWPSIAGGLLLLVVYILPTPN